jgi:hypothetical protein
MYSSYLSVVLEPPLGCVLWQVVQSQTGHHLVCALVLPEQLQLPDRDQVRVSPHLDKEELAQGQDLGSTSLLVGVADRLVKGVGGVVAAGRAKKLHERDKLFKDMRLFSTTLCCFGFYSVEAAEMAHQLKELDFKLFTDIHAAV